MRQGELGKRRCPGKGPQCKLGGGLPAPVNFTDNVTPGVHGSIRLPSSVTILYPQTPMQLGFVSAILPDLSLAEVARFANQAGYDCVEFMCWPVSKAERR